MNAETELEITRMRYRKELALTGELNLLIGGYQAREKALEAENEQLRAKVVAVSPVEAMAAQSGDVIQVACLFHEFTLWIVSEVYEWGVTAYCSVPAKDGETTIQVRHGDFKVIGRAYWMLNEELVWRRAQP